MDTYPLAQNTGPPTHRAVQDPISVGVIQLEGDCGMFQGGPGSVCERHPKNS